MSFLKPKKYWIGRLRGEWFISIGFLKNALELGFVLDWNRGFYLNIGLLICRFTLSYRNS